MPGAPWWSLREGLFLMSEAPLAGDLYAYVDSNQGPVREMIELLEANFNPKMVLTPSSFFSFLTLEPKFE